MKNKIFAQTILMLTLFISASGQGTWVQKTDFTGGPRYTVSGFCIGTKLFMGTGQNSTSFYNDFWAYNPTANTWIQKSNYGGIQRRNPVAFTINNKGYMGTGVDMSNRMKDFWEYDTLTDSWIQKADFGGGLRAGAIGFSIGGKGYLGTGQNGSEMNDFWEYNPITNLWAQKANFPTVRNVAVATSVNGKGYAGLGNTSGPIYYNDWWQYDPILDLWTQKTNFPGGAREGASIFSIGTMIYVGLGGAIPNPGFYYNDFWQYNTLTDTWSQIANFPGQKRELAVGLSLNNKGYVGTGIGSTNYNDFWEYSPAVTTNINELDIERSFSVFPNPCNSETTLQANNFLENATILINNSLGQQVKQIKNISGQKIIIQRDNLESGLYFINLTQDGIIFLKTKLLIADN